MAYPGYPAQKQQNVQGQTLDITVSGCFNLSDKEWFSRQDPYVVIDYAGQRFRTRTDTDGGRNPSFNETFKLSMIEGLREVTATVWNSNTIERDDYIGATKILLNKVIDAGYDDSQWQLTNTYTGKSAGSLKLILHYGAGKTKPSNSNPYGVSAPPAACYTQPPPACGPSYSHQYPAAAPQPYPQPGGYPAAPPQAFVPVYQGPPQPAYPPQPVAYVAPPQPAFPPQPVAYVAPPQPAYCYPGAPVYPQHPPAGYPQPGYNPQYGRGL